MNIHEGKGLKKESTNDKNMLNYLAYGTYHYLSVTPTIC